MADASDALTRDHWYQRPGWWPGRQFYTWHVIDFISDPPISEIVNSYAPMLGAAGVFDLVPARWLHITTQGVSFADTIAESEVRAIVEAARPLLANTEPVNATLGPVDMDAEAAFLPIRPFGQLEAVRTQIRAAISQVLGADQVPEPDSFGWPPHLSLGYTNVSGKPLAPIRDLIRQDARTWRVAINEIALIRLSSDQHLYQWTTVGQPAHIGA
jgi:hypothetical protein